MRSRLSMTMRLGEGRSDAPSTATERGRRRGWSEIKATPARAGALDVPGEDLGDALATLGPGFRALRRDDRGDYWRGEPSCQGRGDPRERSSIAGERV